MLCTMEGKIKLVEGPAEIADQLVEKIKVTIFVPNALSRMRCPECVDYKLSLFTQI
jgi:hypothetical protein